MGLSLFLAKLMKSGQEDNPDISQWPWWPVIILASSLLCFLLLVACLHRTVTAALTGIVFCNCRFVGHGRRSTRIHIYWLGICILLLHNWRVARMVAVEPREERFSSAEMVLHWTVCIGWRFPRR